MLLDEITKDALGLHAVFLNDALITLGIKDGNVLAKLHPHLQDTTELLTSFNTVRPGQHTAGSGP
ncbi:hypothetical protein [Streptomyces sp. NBC_00057]|uniref:hypothetical protein n=1 Tax=Streptomyces sp. NBC_00057 TaxID=2975634 RepID=UPI00324CD7D2